MTIIAFRWRVRGIVQGVGFRPFVFRLAQLWGIRGWVLNGEDGVEIHGEGAAADLAGLDAALRAEAPPAARISSIEKSPVPPSGSTIFEIRESTRRDRPTVRISPDLPVCSTCLAEMADPADRRFGYPYINCTDCGPRFSIILGLPYDRPRTTMAGWPLCPACAAEYADPLDRRFHAQPVACPACGPHVSLVVDGQAAFSGSRALEAAAARLRAGAILAVKGIGGYHLACDAEQAEAVRRLRERKFRKERPFALMVRGIDTARELVVLDQPAEELMLSPARPIVLAPARVLLPEVAPGTAELGVMLPYAPLHHLLFAAGAPPVLVLTSANRSSEPIAFTEEDAFAQLDGIADGFLIGERPIARRVDDSVAAVRVLGPMVYRRSRGLSPAAVGSGWPRSGPVLAFGADLKNAITLVVEGQAFVSQHVGDLDHLGAREAFFAIVDDFLAMYAVPRDQVVVAHDLHPDYWSSQAAGAFPGRKVAIQHHQAHVASVLAERGAWDASVVGVAWDGTGWGEDGSIWGGEWFWGGLGQGLRRIAHLSPVWLPGGDAAALFPPQAAAGFLAEAGLEQDWERAPFSFPPRFTAALSLARRRARCHQASSVGRLFDAAAAILGFRRDITFEGQAAIWLEHQAAGASSTAAFPCPWVGDALDWRPLLRALVQARAAGQSVAECSRAFHSGLALALVERCAAEAARRGADAVVLSGGVFQNARLLQLIVEAWSGSSPCPLWVNHEVPPNDGGIALGQAALACRS